VFVNCLLFYIFIIVYSNWNLKTISTSESHGSSNRVHWFFCNSISNRENLINWFIYGDFACFKTFNGNVLTCHISLHNFHLLLTEPENRSILLLNIWEKRLINPLIAPNNPESYKLVKTFTTQTPFEYMLTDYRKASPLNINLNCKNSVTK
jgi:hypothetical protein